MKAIVHTPTYIQLQFSTIFVLIAAGSQFRIDIQNAVNLNINYSLDLRNGPLFKLKMHIHNSTFYCCLSKRTVATNLSNTQRTVLMTFLKSEHKEATSFLLSRNNRLTKESEINLLRNEQKQITIARCYRSNKFSM